MGVDGEQTGAEVLDRLDQDHGVLAAADGDEQAPRPDRARAQLRSGVGPRPDRMATGRGTAQTVGHGELAEAVVVEVAVELLLLLGQALAFDDHLGGGGGLVVAGSGSHVEVEQGSVAARRVEIPIRRRTASRR